MLFYLVHKSTVNGLWDHSKTGTCVENSTILNTFSKIELIFANLYTIGKVRKPVKMRSQINPSNLVRLHMITNGSTYVNKAWQIVLSRRSHVKAKDILCKL